MNSKKEKLDISDYDSSNYDYEVYWAGREYENLADNIALEKFLKKEYKNIKKGDYYIDIGGSYGRQLEVYSKYFDNIILFDYSLNSLKKAKTYNDTKGLKNVKYVAGNVYFMPFKNSSIESGQIIRVMHHLKNAKLALSEIDRIISKFFILEFANKIHFKYVLKNFKKPMNIFDKNPIQQLFRDSSQGSKGENQIFLNFHPGFITSILKDTRFSKRTVLSVSNFRIPKLKSILGSRNLVKIEALVQSPLAFLNFGPSIYYLLEKKKSKYLKKIDFESILACPNCKDSLEKKANSFSCKNCNLNFNLDEGIYDFRYNA